MLQEGDSDAECRPVDIRLYTWSGPDIQPGECWHLGQRFAHGATWGRTDLPSAPYCVCDHGEVRVFYSQRQPSAVVSSKPVTGADSLTLLRPQYGSSPTPHDLEKWPIVDVSKNRQRTSICSANQLGRRLRSRDGCFVCRCSKNGHWLCRKGPTEPSHQSQPSKTSYSSSRNSANTFNVQLRVTMQRQQSFCPREGPPQICILVERLTSSSSSNGTEKSSRYIEITRGSSWIDHNSCTKCTCLNTGHLKCDFTQRHCQRSCLLHKNRPVPMMYYFPSGSKWITPPHDTCRSCLCINGQRKCINCDQTLKVDIETDHSANMYSPEGQERTAIGEYRILPSKTYSKPKKPCLLVLTISSHRLVLPGQQIWYEGRCYFCSERNGQLISC